MRRYLEYAIAWDFLILIFLSTIIILVKPSFFDRLNSSPTESLKDFGISLITVSSTLIGFLLTIITVIVTFKKGFEDQKGSETKSKHSNNFPKETIFEKKVTKESIFYGTSIHKRVVDVFIYASFEIGIVLVVLLILQFSTCRLSINVISFVHLCALILIAISVVRSLYVFKLFLNVHLK